MMGMLIQLGIYAALIGGAWFAIHSFLGGYEQKGAKKQLEADMVVLEQVKKERDTAVAANKQLQADVAKNAEETLACNEQVNAIRDKGKSAKAIADAERKKAEPKINSLNNRIAELELALATSKQVKPEVSCAKALAKAGSVIAPVAAGRLREPGAAGAGGGVGGAPATSTNPGPDTVRRAP